MTIASKINPSAGSLIHGLHIEGCPYLFVSKVPATRLGNWNAPTDKHSNPFTVLPVLKDMEGLSINVESWNPKEGKSAGNNASFRLRLTDTVLSHFGADNPSNLIAQIAENVGYDIEGERNRYEIPTVEELSSFPAQGILYCGRETVCYTTKLSTSFGDGTIGSLVRGCYNWQSDSRLDRYHRTHIDSTKVRTPYLVSNVPLSWKGKRVTLLQWLCDPNGYAIDGAYHGTHEIEIWSGFVDVINFADYATLEISCTSLAGSILEKEIGFDNIKGQIGTFVDPKVTIRPGKTIKNIHTMGNYNGANYSTGRNYFNVTSDGQTDRSPMVGTFDASVVAAALGLSLSKAINQEIAAEIVTDPPEVVISGSIIWENIDEEEATENVPAGTPAFRFVLNFSCPDLENDDVMHLSVRFGAFGNVINWTSETIDINGPDDIEEVVGNKIPHLLFVNANTNQLSCLLEPDETRAFPESGFALIEAKNGVEIVRYASKTTNDDGTFVLNRVQRGRMRTVPIAFSVPLGFNPEIERPKITAIYGFDRVPLVDAMLSVLLSTGQSAYGTFDILPEACGLGLDPAAIDNASFLAQEGDSYSLRTIALNKTIKVGDFFGPNCIFHGYLVGARTGTDGRFRLSLIAIGGAVDNAIACDRGTNVDSGILIEPLPMIRTSTDLITRIRANLRYNPATSEFEGTPADIVFYNGMQVTNDREALSIEVEGMASSDVVGAATFASERIFELFGKPRPIVQFATDRRALLLSPGMMVRVTIPDIPTTFGTRGLSLEKAMILSISKDWFSVGDNPACEIEAMILPSFGGIAPTFRIVGYDEGSHVVTLADNDFCNAGDPNPTGTGTTKDHLFGPLSGETYRIVVFNRGDYGNREELSATYLADGQWTLSGALSLAIGPETYVEFAPYGTSGRNDFQSAYAHIEPITGATSTIYKWSF